MHVFLCALGSRGDIELFLILGRELRQRGHRVIVATSPFHADRVREAGLE